MQDQNAIYTGWVKHTRKSPAENTFTYKIFKPLVDLDQLENATKLSRWWSLERFNLAAYKRADHFGDAALSLSDTVRKEIADKLHRDPAQLKRGKVLMLAHWRYFGYAINPITMFYYFNEAGKLDAIISEVTNTPWGEKCTYALDWQADGPDVQKFQTDKILHVSPFLPMDMVYHWSIKAADDQMIVHLENHQDGEKKFAATLSMQPKAWNKRNMNKVLRHYPFMTIKVVTLIYWQAVKLWVKRVKVIDHPGD